MSLISEMYYSGVEDCIKILQDKINNWDKEYKLLNKDIEDISNDKSLSFYEKLEKRTEIIKRKKLLMIKIETLQINIEEMKKFIQDDNNITEVGN